MENLEVISFTKTFIFDISDNLLQMKRRESDKRGGSWDLPGGKLLPGELPINGAIREIQEETSFNFSEEELLAFPEVRIDESRDHDHINKRFFYMAKLLIPHPKVLLSNEHTAYEWIPARRGLVSLGHTVQRQVLKGVLEQFIIPSKILANQN